MPGRAAPPEGPAAPLRGVDRRRTASAVGHLLLGAALALLVLQFGFTLVRVHGGSMQPTLHEGDVLLVLRPPLAAMLTAAGVQGATQVARGAVVVFPEPGTGRHLLGAGPAVVKRIVGLPGESVGLSDGRLLVDGAAVAEPWLTAGGRGAADAPARTLADGQLYVLGDNRLPLGSRDSRQYGPVAEASLRGRAVAIIRSPYSGGRWRVPWVLLT